jgi:hypothetical protein
VKVAGCFGSAGLWLKEFTAGDALDDWRNILLHEGNTPVGGRVAGYGLWDALQR